IYTGNMLIDCDGEVPHNETSIAVNPNDPKHVVGAYHSYQVKFRGATAIAPVIGTVSVSTDGGENWREVVPPITPYQFTGDPALSFNADGRLYFGNIADHEGPGGSYTSPSVVVAHSDDGGFTWSNPVAVATGLGAVTKGRIARQVFQDKDFIAADAYAGSPYKNRVYVTWTSFQENPRGVAPFFRSPIQVSLSDDGNRWSGATEISGYSPFCIATLSGAPNECDLNQYSIPAIAPTGKVYVAFENFNTPAENQYMVVNSTDGGQTWGAPSRVDTVYDINYPEGVSGDSVLTGCEFRVNAAGNIATDPSDASGDTAYLVWADNRNGSEEATNVDVFLGRTTDGGATWIIYPVDTDSNDQFYPWVAVAPDGRVDVGYMDRSYSEGQTECKYGFSLTRLTFDAGGITSQSKTRVDTGLSNPGNSRWFSAATDGNGTFIGDYNGVAAGSDGTTWSLWTDQRAEVENPPSPTRKFGQHAVGSKTPAP
ncbi:MAG TPA: sialidase family protein, partial [Bryobacteraceae bacterium]|nr:sialidase family protein [Bryobacteraceae bacterium]